MTGVVGSQRRPRHRKRDHDIDRDPKRHRMTGLRLGRQRLGKHLDEQIHHRDQGDPDRVPGQQTHHPQRAQGHDGGQRTGTEDDSMSSVRRGVACS